MGDQKFYGVFKFCFDSRNSSYKEEIAINLYNRFIAIEKDTWYLKTNPTNKDDAFARASEQRWADQQERKRQSPVYHRYKHKFIVHQCDKNGVWITSKAELARALLILQDSMKNFIKNNPPAPEFEDYLDSWWTEYKNGKDAHVEQPKVESKTENPLSLML